MCGGVIFFRGKDGKNGISLTKSGLQGYLYFSMRMEKTEKTEKTVALTRLDKAFVKKKIFFQNGKNGKNGKNGNLDNFDTKGQTTFRQL